MSAGVCTADLAEGSIDATRTRVWIKDGSVRRLYPWQRDGGIFPVADTEIDHAIASGATVLRHGYGEEQS